MALAFAGCGGSGGGTESGVESRDARIEGPIAGLVAASGVDKFGRAVAPTFTFSPQAPEIAVFVTVGKVTGSPLTIAWYRGEQKLFEHTVEVKSFDYAFSTGRNPRRLALGTYRTVATLGGKSVEIEWDVAAKGAQAAAAGGAGSPPVEGESGVVRPRLEEAGPDDACDPELITFDGRTGEAEDRDADRVEFVMKLRDRSACTEPADITLEGTVQGPYEPLTNVPGRTGFASNPCNRPGGSDLPGTVVRFRATSGHWRTEIAITLGEDTLAPRVRVNANPAAGARVDPGDEIRIEVVAQERRRYGPWQTGVQQIQVIGPDGLVGKETFFGRAPRKCAEKQWEGEHEVTYVVPGNPPPVIRLCTLAEDHVGNEGSSCGNYFTGEVWAGTASTKLKAPICSGTSDARYRLTVAADGSVGGSGETKWTQLRGSCRGFGPAKLQIGGKRTKTAFELDFTVLGPYGSTFKVTVPIRGNTAEATVERPAVPQTETYKLTCETCAGAPGG